MSTLSQLNRHKTKALGIATIVLGALQTAPQLPDLLSPTAYSWTMMIVGIGVLVCGFLNSSQETSDANDQAG